MEKTMYILRCKNEATEIFGKYRYLESHKNGVDRLTPSKDNAKRFTDEEAENGVTVANEYEFIKVSK